VLDEPFNALDAAGAELLDHTLEELTDRAVVVATHDPERVERLATKRLTLI
jgi:ABC-type sulfate/molybdate transport systems ATPase subunit